MQRKRRRAVGEVFDTGCWETVYNLRVADFHTYFVGCEEWGFGVWAHNEYGSQTELKRIYKRLERSDLPDEVKTLIHEMGGHRLVDEANASAWVDRWTPAELRRLAALPSQEAMHAEVLRVAAETQAPGSRASLLQQLETLTSGVEYNREAYGNTRNTADMTALKNANHGLPCPEPGCTNLQTPASPDHDPALGIHWFVGDGKGGKPGIVMTQLDREAYAGSSASIGRTVCTSCNYGDGPAINSQVNALMRQYLAGELWWQQQGLYGWKKP